MLSQADAGPREYRRRGRTVNATRFADGLDATTAFSSRFD
jgi:hypothetical protein